MAFKFNEITFDLKDILLIIGLVAGYFNFKSEQKEQFTQLKSEIQQIIADNKIQEIKFNAKFDLLSKPTSEKKTAIDTINFIAIVNNDRIEIVKKRLVKIRLV
jgi:hypothetical protein